MCFCNTFVTFICIITHSAQKIKTYFSINTYFVYFDEKKGVVKPMDVVLKQYGSNVGMYIDKKLATVFENKSIEQTTDWIEKNLKGAKIHIVS